MGILVDCEFHSIWDGESSRLTSSAKVDLDTGLVSEIEEIDEELSADVETLDRQCITIGDAEFDFEHKTDSFRVRDLGRLRNHALDTVMAPSPII